MLEGQFTRLRPLDLADAEWMRRLRTSPAVMEAFQYRYPITDLQQEEFLRKLSVDREQFYFVAEDPGSAKPFRRLFPPSDRLPQPAGRMRHLLGSRGDRRRNRRFRGGLPASATTPTRI